MANWAQFEASEPEFASRVRDILTRRKHLTMATLRSDGSPRISGIEVDYGDGELTIKSMPGSVKAWDLIRDPRMALHGPTEDPHVDNPAEWIGEPKIAGRAVRVDSEGPGDRFLIDLQEAVITRLNEAGNRLVIESWHDDRGYKIVERE